MKLPLVHSMLGLYVIYMAGLAVACSPISILNPDPVHGGACGDGDQLATLCPDRVTCCPAGYHCTSPHGCAADVPGPSRFAARDGG